MLSWKPGAPCLTEGWKALWIPWEKKLISKINFEVVWRWKRRLASEPALNQWGGTMIFWNMLQRNLLEFKRTVQTGPLWNCSTESMWQVLRAQLRLRLILTTIKVLFDYTRWFFHSTEKIQSNYFRNLPVNLTVLTLSIWFYIKKGATLHLAQP